MAWRASPTAMMEAPGGQIRCIRRRWATLGSWSSSGRTGWKRGRGARSADRVHQAALGPVGVLVLVAQDVLEPGPELLEQLGVAFDQLDGLGDLVAEVEAAPPPLLGRVPLDQAGQLGPLPCRLEHPVGQPPALARPRGGA